MKTTLIEKNKNRTGKSLRHQEKKKRIKNYIEQVNRNIGTQEIELHTCLTNLCDYRKLHISDLIQYIFCLDEIKPKRLSF